MAAFFLLLAVLVGVVLVDAVLENTANSTVVLFDRSIDQLSGGEMLILFAGLGFLLTLFLFLAFGSSRTRRSRRKELKSRRRDAEGRVDELERENARLRQELETVNRGRVDAVAERDRAEATADRVRAGGAARQDRTTPPGEHQRTGAGAFEQPPAPDDRSRNTRGASLPPEPTSVRRERLDDRTEISPVRDDRAHPADDEARRR